MKYKIVRLLMGGCILRQQRRLKTDCVDEIIRCHCSSSGGQMPEVSSDIWAGRMVSACVRELILVSTYNCREGESSGDAM
jgi:hypothetical protein